MISKRHWNVERHIRISHEGLGRPILSNIYPIIKTKIMDSNSRINDSVMQTLMPSMTNTSSLDQSRDLVKIVDRHLLQTVHNAADKMSISTTRITSIRGIACKRCLTIDIFEDKSSLYAPMYRHICDFSWMISEPQVLKDRDILANYVSNQLYAMLARTVKRLNGDSPITLTAGEMDRRFMYNVLPRVIAANYDQLRKDTPPVYDYVSVDEEASISIDHLYENKDWIRHAIQNGRAELDDKELDEFLRIAQASSSFLAKKKDKSGVPGWWYFSLMLRI